MATAKRRPIKTVGRRPSSLVAALDNPKSKALTRAVADAVYGGVDSNAAAWTRATRTVEEQEAAAVQVLRGGAPEAGWSSVSAPGVFVACGLCSPLDEPIRDCPNCRLVHGSDLLDYDGPILVVDHRMKVKWINRAASLQFHNVRPIGKLVRTVVSRAPNIEPVVLQIETVPPYQGNSETFRREKHRFAKSLGMRVAPVTLPDGRRIPKLHFRAK